MTNSRLAIAVLIATLFTVSPSGAQPAAEARVLELNTRMMRLYDGALQNAQGDLLRNHPVILALFNSQGGRMILYRPGKAPLQAPRVPVTYELLKSVAHSSMAVFAHLYASEGKPVEAWRGPLLTYRETSQQALDALPEIDMQASWKANMREILRRNIAFMDATLKRGRWTREQLSAYASEMKPFLERSIAWAAETQVEHWMDVIARWKRMLGPQWKNTLGASNTLYVTRQNNVLYSVLAQYFGREAVNGRLFLFETSAFTTEPEHMLSLLARIHGDREVGHAFFKDYYLMDYELMGGNAHRAIVAQDKARGLPVNLPPLVPFHSWEWPMRHDPSQGTGPARLEEVR